MEDVNFSTVIMWIMACGAIVGGADLILGNRFGLGDKFEEGFHAMGPLALAMVGMICLAPVIADLLKPVVIPVLTAMNADPGVFAGLMPNDAGGYPLAMQLAVDRDAGLYAGLLVGAMLGCTVMLTVPLALTMMEKEDQPYLAKGVLLGLIVVPFGSVAGGLVAGFSLSFLFWNTLPVAIVSFLFALGLLVIPAVMIRVSILLGRFIRMVVTFGIMLGAFTAMTGIVLIERMAPISEAMEIIGTIGVVLLGTFPAMHLLIKVLKKPLGKLGNKFDMDAVSTACIVITLANPVPIFKLIKDMCSRGKVVNTAFMCTAATAFGDHLGFTAAVEPDSISMVVLGKLAGGAAALVLALIWTRSTETEDAQSEKIRLDMAAKAAKRAAAPSE